MLQAQIGVKGCIPVPRSLQDRPAELVAMFLWIKETRLDDKVLTGKKNAGAFAALLEGEEPHTEVRICP